MLGLLGFVILAFAKGSVVKLNESMLATWYDSVAICMLKESTPSSKTPYSTLLSHCKAKTALVPQFPDGFAHLSFTPFPDVGLGQCCVGDLSLSERGFDVAWKGFENGMDKPMVKLLNLLSSQRKSIITIGDSSNLQFFEAMVLEIRRANFGRIIEKPKLYWLGQSYRSLGLRRPDLNIIRRRMAWRPPMPGDKLTGREVFLYHIDLLYARHEQKKLFQVILPFLCTVEHPEGVLLLANVGNDIADHRRESPTELYMYMNNHLRAINRLAFLNPKSIVAFRETIPSHYNSPMLDGSFELWTDSFKSKYDFKQPNRWDNTMYHCRAISHLESPHFEQSNTPENTAAMRLYQSWDTNKKRFFILPTFQFLAPFHRLKRGHCGKSDDRVGEIDCMHYCSNAPPMWAPVWNELLKLVVQWNTFVSPYIRSVRPEIPLYSILDDFESNWTYGEASVIEGDPYGELYLKRGGMKFPVSDWEDITRRTGRGKDGLEVHRLNREELKLIPQGPVFHSYPDGTLVKSNIKNVLYYMKDNIRHHVPDLDTFNAMNLNEGKILVLPREVLESLELGDPLPRIAMPAPVAQEPVVQSYPDGTLIKADGKHQLYYIKDNIRHHVPDLDTFTAMNLQEGKIVVVPKHVLERLELGDPLPKISSPEESADSKTPEESADSKTSEDSADF